MVDLFKANLCDIPAMQDMVSLEVKDGIILERKSDEVATNIRSYILAKIDDKLVGYCALHIHSSRLAEIRSLIVLNGYRGKNIGKRLVEFALNEAKYLSVSKEILVLTYIPDFFKKMNFIEIPKESIPEHKIWADCIKCIHFPICEEISLVYRLGE